MKKCKPSMENGMTQRAMRKPEPVGQTSTRHKREPFGEWIPTRAAAELTGYSQHHIAKLCALGFFVKGKEWRQRSRTPGSRRSGRIWIRHSALKKMGGG